MERFLFKTIPVWVVGLLMAFGLGFLVVFGMLVRNHALGYDRFGWFGTIAYEIASVPVTIKKLADQGERMASTSGGERFSDQSGWSSPATGISGYLVLSRFDGDSNSAVVELLSLPGMEILHEWQIDAEEIFRGLRVSDKYHSETILNRFYRAIHPLLLPNGDIIVKDHQAAVARVSACGTKIWTNETAFHHAAEFGPNGNIWSASLVDATTLPGVNDNFYDDGVTSVSPDGEIIFNKSLSQILIDNGYEYLVNGMLDGYDVDPLHLNDIQPVFQDGPHWKRGDVFLSMRHKSTVALYRPTTNEILWLKSGPWLFQHDVDVLNDHQIAIFNNNVQNRAGSVVNGSNQITVFDFETGSISEPYASAFEDYEIRTLSEGLFTVLDSGHVMIEEENSGRLLFLDAAGQKVTEYINRALDGDVYRLAWSRYLDPEYGATVLAALEGTGCGVQDQ